MKNRVKLVVFFGLMTFPMMMAFQNCSRTVAMQVTDEVNGKLDSDLLPNGVSEIDQQTPSDGGSSPAIEDGVSRPVDGDLSAGEEEDPDMNTQVEDPQKEFQSDMDSAVAACAADLHESQNDQNGELSDDGRSLTHIRGYKVISAADFNGLTEIDEISDSYGTRIICGLHVASLKDSGGNVVLVDSLVDDLSHVGKIGIVESRAILSGSKAIVNKQNSYAPDVTVVAQGLRHRTPSKQKK